MIRLKESARVKVMTLHGFIMLALGLGLFYLRASMTEPLFYVLGGAFTALLVAASLLLIAGLDWLCAASLGRRQVNRLRGLLFLSTAVAACAVFMIFYPGSSMRLLCYVLAVYALSLNLGKFGLAMSWNGTKRERVVMYTLAVVALAFSVALVAFAGQKDRDATAVIATYFLFAGFQMLLAMYFLLQQQALKSRDSLPRAKRASV
jgi:hypothetical protein